LQKQLVGEQPQKLVLEAPKHHLKEDFWKRRSRGSKGAILTAFVLQACIKRGCSIDDSLMASVLEVPKHHVRKTSGSEHVIAKALSSRLAS